MTVTLATKVSDEVAKRLEDLASQKGVSVYVLLRDIIESYARSGSSPLPDSSRSRPSFSDMVSTIAAHNQPILGVASFPAYEDDQLRIALGYRILPVPVGDTVYLFFFAREEFLFAVNVWQLFKALISVGDVLYGYPQFARAARRYESWLKDVLLTWSGILKDLLSSVGRSEEDK